MKGPPNRSGINWQDRAQVRVYNRHYQRQWRIEHGTRLRLYRQRAWRKRRAEQLRAYHDYIARLTGLHREKVRQVLEAYERAKKEAA